VPGSGIARRARYRTRMSGTIETMEERVEPLEGCASFRTRGGFTAFIDWTLQPEHTDMAEVPPAGACEYLPHAGLARRIRQHPQHPVSWVTRARRAGRWPLCFGANDRAA